MDDKEKKDEYIEDLRGYFKSDVIDDPEALCKFINQKVIPFIDSLDKKNLLDAYERLDEITGGIPIFSLGDKVSLEVKKNRLLYFVQEIIDFIIPLVQIGIRAIDFSSMKITQEKKELIKLLGISNNDLLNAYVKECETQFALFIKPTYSKLKNKKLVEDKTGLKFQIKKLKEFFEKDAKLKPLCPLMDILNADIRNAIVHLEFYIDNQEDCLYYYSREHDPKPKPIPLSEICKFTIILYVVRIITGILICRKMVKIDV